MNQNVNVDDLKIDILPVSARCLSLKKNSYVYLEKQEGIITKITIKDKSFELFDNLLFTFKDIFDKPFTTSYFVNCIVEVGNDIYIHSEKLNLSYLYVLPSLILDINKCWLNSFISNTYLVDDDIKKIIIKCRATPSDSFIALDEYLCSLPGYMCKKDLDISHSYYTFVIPSEYQDDFLKFKEGLYSQFSDKLKRRIINCHRTNKVYKRIKGVLYKEKKLKEYLENYFECTLNELETKPKMKYELLNNEYIR